MTEFINRLKRLIGAAKPPESITSSSARPWWDRVLCRIGSHDWRNMDGICASCGWVDPLWHCHPTDLDKRESGSL